MERKPRVGFICTKNTGRSQLAEALAKWYGKDVIESYSAGTYLGESLSPEAVEAMLEVYDVDMRHEQFPKTMDDIPEVDILVNLCGEDVSDTSAKYYEEWDVEDPESDEAGYLGTIAVLEEKIKYLIDLIIRGRYPIDEDISDEEEELPEVEEVVIEEDEDDEQGYNVEKLHQEY